ncbi:Integrase core domain-containing protein [Pseudonocardia ammonioxydans]|uniref:Integrase core domain-containing protein n=1 Tax=Pseudonocardia ammonioxydans TaxID=260086 RepID=A0A1I5FY56_PSUAM|nr:Integrase core domain-containing protein [Pseudonocardia ammonioxydans]
MSHANAALTPRARLRLAQLVVDHGWTYAAAAKMFMVSARTAKKWADRYRAEGAAGMLDRSSRPHSSPTRTGPRLVRRIVRLRRRHRLGPVQIGGRLGMAASTVHAVLVRCEINRLSRIDRVTGEPLRRYEHPHPGSLIHVDVTKFANIPDGGGWRYQGRQQGRRNQEATARRTGARGSAYRPVIGTAFVHTVIDDHSRTAYAEICTDEKAATAIGVLERAVAWFAERGVTVERSCPTTARPTSPTPGATPAPSRPSPTNGPAPTGPRPTERSKDSTAPWPTGGPTPGSTTQPGNATTPCPAGCTSTITTALTPPSAADHRSPG